MTGGNARRKRARARHQAGEAIRDASDEELRNLRYELGREINSRNAEVSEMRSRLGAVNFEIERRKRGTSSGLTISDHAVLRYLERVKGVDMHAVRKEIAAMAMQAKVSRDGPYGLREHNGMVFGSDEEQSTITTVFRENEMAVMNVAGGAKSPGHADLGALLAATIARFKTMPPEERIDSPYRTQIESLARMSCEHGVADWETCPKCRGWSEG